MPYAPIEGGQLYYEEHGRGTPLVLVHGFNGWGQAWAPRLPAFVEHNRVIVPDLRGHGRSTGAPETIRHAWFARDLVALLDHLGIDRAHFVGHSSGGMCLLFVGREHPARIRTLSLVCATYTFDEHARREMYRVVEAATQPEAIEASRQRHGPVHGDDYWQVLRDAFRGFADDAARELPFTLDDLRVISRPVLVVHGDRDPFFPVNIPVAMYRALPNAELCILPATGHAPPFEQPDLLVAMIQRFLERHADA